MYLRYLLSLAVAVSSVVAQEPKSVFAHFIVSYLASFYSPPSSGRPQANIRNQQQVGNAAVMTPDEWESDIRQAKEAHIDGFALNIAAQDSNTDAVLERAYTAASSVGGFTMFLSFDYLSGGPWPVGRVISTINAYKNSP